MNFKLKNNVSIDDLFSLEQYTIIVMIKRTLYERVNQINLIIDGMKINDNTKDKMSLDLITFAADTYGFSDVYKLREDFNFEYLTENYGINEETNYFLIEEYFDYLDILDQFGEVNKTTKLASEPMRYVYLFVSRVAASSSFIEVNYNFFDVVIDRLYPSKNKAGDEALFTCYDFIKIPYKSYLIFEMSGAKIYDSIS